MVSEPSVWKWACETLRHYWRYMFFLCLASGLIALAGFLVPMIWQRLLDNATTGSFDYRMAFALLAVLAVQAVPVMYLLRERFINRYRFDTRHRLFKHMLRLSIPFHKDRESTKLVMESSKAVEASTDLMKFALQGRVMADVPVAIASVVYIALNAPQRGLILGILAVFFVVFLFFNKHFGSRISAVVEEWNKLDNDISTRSREVLQHIETVKLHLAEEDETDWYQGENHKIRALQNRENIFGAWFGTMSELSGILPFCISLFVFLPYVAEGSLSIGTLVALQLYCSRAVRPAGFLGDMYQEIRTNAAKLKPALRTLAQKPTVAEVAHPVDMQPLRHSIELKDVSFRYDGASDCVIENLSLVITAGERVAIVGPTGSGKSTLAKLLTRLYDPTHGLIIIDGTDLRQYSFETLYKETSYVMQEVPIFSGTIGDNIGYGLDCHENQLRDACESASADFVFTKKQGLTTKVGELGEKLSGGEQQRLALARVFLRHPSLLILDEATSRLDETTQRQVQEAFMKLNGGTTIVAIAHRITTVMHADRIVVLDEGQIVDSGTHQELLERCQLYQELCREMKEMK